MESNSPTETKEFVDVYQIVTDQIIDQLNKGKIPWHKPWGDTGMPQNLITKHAYRGINQLLLASLGYTHNYFVTWEQIKKVKGSVKKGERGHLVVFWKMVEKEIEGSEETKKSSFLRYFKVFNVDQCTDIPETLLQTMEFEKENQSIQKCVSIAELMPQRPIVTYKGTEAWYDKGIDTVNVPSIKKFEDNVGFYGVLFHELVHSTGHEKRLNRKDLTEKTVFGSPSYSIEELTAEIGACFLLTMGGVGKQKHIQNSAGYIQGWLEKLQNDKRFIIHASTYAQKAVDYILDVTAPLDDAPVESNISKVQQ